MEIKHIKKKSQIETGFKVQPRERVAAYCRVSTDTEEQLKSFNSMVDYYTKYISTKPEWEFVGVYSDEAVTGTKVEKRDGFKRLIQDCVDGKIDRIVTKSISRFARNTEDTLKYVRLLRERGIGITFESPSIDTLKDGELFLSILSAIAQQEVENISASVKKGLQFKMSRGELVGGTRCLGYDYDRETRNFFIIEEEANLVKEIFELYTNGAGCDLIARKLNERGLKTVRGNDWSGSTILGIIRNEKYVGDIQYGKTFTVDPISKRRLVNQGEEDQYYIEDHHEPIISREIFEKAQKIVNLRGYNRKKAGDKIQRIKYSRKYTFSSLLFCGFCDCVLTRRSWHAGSIYQKTIWMCVASTKRGKIFCPDSKGVSELDIEEAFMAAYHKLTNDNEKAVERFTARVEKTLGVGSIIDKITKTERKIQENKSRRETLLAKYIDGKIAEDVYQSTEEKLLKERDRLASEIAKLKEKSVANIETENRLKEFKKAIKENRKFEKFDRTLFESLVEKVIVGGYDDEDKPDPYRLTFIFKNGFGQEINVKEIENKSKENAEKKDKGPSDVCLQTGVELCSNAVDDTCGVRGTHVETHLKI